MFKKALGLTISLAFSVWAQGADPFPGQAFAPQILAPMITGATAAPSSSSISVTSQDNGTTTRNLTTEGPDYWIAVGQGNTFAVADTKSSGSGIGAVSSTGSCSAGPTLETGDGRNLSWSDGTPTSSESTFNDGVYMLASATSCAITFNITTAAHTTYNLYLHLAGYKATGTMITALNDGSGLSVTDSSYGSSSGLFDANYEITLKTATASTATVTWQPSSTGFVAGASVVAINGVAY